MPSILIIKFALSISHAVTFQPLVFAACFIFLNCVLSVGLVGFIGVFGGLLIVDFDDG